MTGASGYIASELVKQLLEKECKTFKAVKASVSSLRLSVSDSSVRTLQGGLEIM